MDGEEQQPVIVVKKKGGHGGHHGGSWKVAYADFVTAMMAFFLVMWLVSQNQIIRENVAGYFNDPANWGKKGKNSILEGGSSVLPKSNASLPRQQMDVEAARKTLEAAGNTIRETLQGIPEFESINEHIKIEMTPEGLRIQLIEATSTTDDSSYFFDLGSPYLSETGAAILSVIAANLGKLEHRIVIEGHTDSRKYTYNEKYSNWELSADRANSSRKLMEEKGLCDGQVFEIRGYAANRPMIEENPLDARNRRIAILMLVDDPSKINLSGIKPISMELPSLDTIGRTGSGY
jgi:chemotaxis protein MotB